MVYNEHSVKESNYYFGRLVMNKFAKKILTFTLFALFILGISFVQSSYTDCGSVQAASFEWGTVNSAKLEIRRSPNAGSKTIVTLKKGTRVKCLNLKTTWVKLTYGNYTGYALGKNINTAYGTASQPYLNVRYGVVMSDTLVIRQSASASSLALKTLKRGTSLTVLTSGSKWVKVKYGTKVGYAPGDDISLRNGATAANPKISKGQLIVNYAKKFLGNRYVWGGTSLTNGTDCSGFTMRIFEHFGYRLPRTSAEQRSAGTKLSSLSQARAGDLICYYGHVAIYMGNNTIIHASNARDGIKISYNAAYRPIASIRRIIK